MSTVNSLWIKWKMLRLPWRKKFLIGQDLHGNTYWELLRSLPSASSTISARPRRIMRPAHKASKFHSDIQISPAWHQWLRQSRIEPPTIQEQHADMARMQQLKYNAKLADQRWEGKKKYFQPLDNKDVQPAKRMDTAVAGQIEGHQEVEGEGKGRGKAMNDETAIEGIAKGDVQSPQTEPVAPEVKTETQKNPWKEADEAAAGSDTEWKPAAWIPGGAAKKKT